MEILWLVSQIAFDPSLARALHDRLRPLLPWWFRFKIELSPEASTISYRVLRPSFRAGRDSWWGIDPTEKIDVEVVIEDVLLAVQSAVWNCVHRLWPVASEKLGAGCSYDALPEPEVEVRQGAILLRFGHGEDAVTLSPIPVSGR